MVRPAHFFEDEITQGVWGILWMMSNDFRSRMEEGLQRIGKGTKCSRALQPIRFGKRTKYNRALRPIRSFPNSV